MENLHLTVKEYSEGNQKNRSKYKLKLIKMRTISFLSFIIGIAFISNPLEAQTYATKHWPAYDNLLGSPDGLNPTCLQDNQAVYVGFDTPITDISGYDFKINEHADNEYYKLYAIDGQQNNSWTLTTLNWIYLGEFYGNEEIDISSAGLSNVYWIKIVGVANSTGGCEIESVVNYSNTSSISTIEKNKLIVSPNPARNNVKIKLNESEVQIVNIELYDISGKMVYMKPHKSNSVNLNLSGFKKGTYILKVKDNKGQIIKTEKIVKE